MQLPLKITWAKTWLFSTRSISVVLKSMIILIVVQAQISQTLASKENVSIGALRWDGWFKGSLYQKYLAPKQWHNRLPFYARILPDGKIEIQADRQEVMDQEIAYAHQAGLDYWAFVYSTPSIRDDGFNHDDLNRCRKLYLTSKQKNMINFCLVVSPTSSHDWPLLVSDLAQLVKEPTYKKVAGGRPLIYMLLWGIKPEKIFASWTKARMQIDYLREQLIAIGAANPYLVAQVITPQEGTKYIDKLGLDAISSYATCEGKTYAELAYNAEMYWKICNHIGKELVPLVTTGWDPRPLGQPGGPQPTPLELEAHLGRAIDWVRKNPSTAKANTVLLYAWNELAEGGWLVPTRGEGTARLEAVRRASETESAPVCAH